MISSFYSGFSLKGEKELFSDFLIENDFTVSGFSYGAIKAFETAFNSSKRVDKLQLFSPAFFQSQDEKFKRMQLMFFKKDEETYCKNFLKNVASPSDINMNVYFQKGDIKELEELLYYVWDKAKLQSLIDKGIEIEVYLGEQDKIVDSKKAMDFFKEFATVYFIKKSGHILK
jgi:hypothetical protein